MFLTPHTSTHLPTPPHTSPHLHTPPHTFTQLHTPPHPTTEVSEADAVVCLCPVADDKFGYALANGIVGVYGGEERLWRIKVYI